MAELKTCPFCGAELCLKGNIEYAEYRHPDNDCILADADSEYGPLWFDASDNKYIKKWNRRAGHGKNDAAPSS